MNTFRSQALCSSLLAVMAASVSTTYADSIRAEASASWIWSSDDPTPKTGKAKGDSTFSVGETHVTVGGQTNSDAQKSFKYSNGFESQLQIGQGGNIDKQLSTGTALDSMKPGKLDPQSQLYNYEMKAYVLSAPYLFGSKVSAAANAADPQQIDLPGTFGYTIGLEQGSFVYVSPDHLSEGDSEIHLQATAPGILLEPIATIDVVETLTDRTVNVHFNDDPRLTFYLPGSTTPVTDTSIQALISGTSSLFTADGLTADLPLFNYKIDLSDSTLNDASALGSTAQSYSEAIYLPEPGTLVLAATGALLCALRLRKRLR